MRMNLDDLGPGAPGWNAGTFAGNGVDGRVLLSAAAIGGALLLDRVADRYALSHIHDTTSIALHHVGSAMPYAELGVAGIAWLGLDDPRASRTGLTSVEAGLTAALAAEGLKAAIRRERPGSNLGPDDYGHASKLDGSFPSLHSSLAWAVLTPAAQEYDAPWLYGVAALTNAGRLFGRDHWLSDTVAGSVLGYWIGDAFHAHNATRDASAPRVAFGPRAVGLVFPLP
jgi:membrane-associated phospholipid phosphatase